MVQESVVEELKRHHYLRSILASLPRMMPLSSLAEVEHSHSWPPLLSLLHRRAFHMVQESVLEELKNPHYLRSIQASLSQMTPLSSLAEVEHNHPRPPLLSLLHRRASHRRSMGEFSLYPLLHESWMKS